MLKAAKLSVGNFQEGKGAALWTLQRLQVSNLQDVNMGVRSKGCRLATYKGIRAVGSQPMGGL